MSFRTAPQRDPLAPRRAALYLRVSTGRQAAGDVSIPSQRDLTQRFCEAQGWIVSAEFIEPGASATDDRRPAFQRMLDEATAPDRRFDIICVHAFSRFYRNGAEMELTIRKLRKHGVEVVSVTQPTGDDPSQELMRQIIGIFDEYTSRENGKNVVRAMRESARQGFWNGTTPALGYRIVAAERRGSKVKKRLEVDPVEAELVRLIFRLYSEGDGRSGPLGVKETTKWLNEHGYRTRRGATFGVGPLHRILTSKYYATGKWPYGRRNARTGGLNDPATIVEIEIPPIIPPELFEKVHARLARNNPRVTPPRIVNGPTLLTGLATCAGCGAGMTRTGTRRRDRSYSYYSCAGCHQKGHSVCRGQHIPMAKLDGLVIENVKERLFTPERLTTILESLLERQHEKNRAVEDRRTALVVELAATNEKLNRLYRAIEDGIVDLDPQLKERVDALRTQRDLAQASLDRIATQANTRAMITAERLAAFSRLMREKLDSGDTQARKAYLHSVISQIEVDNDKIRIIGDKATLAAAIAGRQTGEGQVRGFVRKWRARRDSNSRPPDSKSAAPSVSSFVPRKFAKLLCLIGKRRFTVAPPDCSRGMSDDGVEHLFRNSTAEAPGLKRVPPCVVR
jgi:site-specific DNA recombinase